MTARDLPAGELRAQLRMNRKLREANGLSAPRGRPALPAEERQRHRLTVRLTDDERAELAAYAEREGVGLAEAVRDAALRAARWRP